MSQITTILKSEEASPKWIPYPVFWLPFKGKNSSLLAFFLETKWLFLLKLRAVLLFHKINLNFQNNVALKSGFYSALTYSRWRNRLNGVPINAEVWWLRKIDNWTEILMRWESWMTSNLRAIKKQQVVWSSLKSSSYHSEYLWLDISISISIDVRVIRA